MSQWIGIDTGGTFTDFVCVDQNGQVTIAKTPSTPRKHSDAIEAGLQLLARKLGVGVKALLSNKALVINHGSTRALNALIQHKGAQTGLITTAGFRDLLELREGHKEKRYDFHYPPPKVLVPRYLRLGVSERVDKYGNVVAPLDEADVRRAIEIFRAEGVEAVAVCFLWSFQNPAHEQRVGEMLREALPNVYVTLSVECLPQIRPYDRVSTCVLNSYLGPIVGDYVADIEQLLSDMGFVGNVRYVQSNGGIAARRAFVAKPVSALNSGPASGPAAGLFFAQQLGIENIITVDMGGTSFDICLVKDGVPTMVKNIDVHRYRVGVPMVDINTLGAGGGSIAWIDDGGILRVGPQSAEAVPGPACYMRGGSLPTVTDANVLLGYLNPEHLLAGAMPIDRAAAERAIEDHVARPLRLGVTEAAFGIFEVVNQNMIAGIRAVSIERGHDPRDFVLMCAGGGAAMHIVALAVSLGISKIIVPRIASVFCAFGQTVADVRHDYVRSYVAFLKEADSSKLESLFREMEQEGLADLRADGFDSAAVHLTRSIDLRYRGQVSEVTVELSGDKSGELPSAAQITEIFHARHKELYTFADKYSEVEVVNLMVTARVALPKLTLTPNASQVAVRAAAGADVVTRPVYFNDYAQHADVRVCNADDIAVGSGITGPVIVEEETTSIVVPPGWNLELDPRHFFLLTKEVEK